MEGWSKETGSPAQEAWGTEEIFSACPLVTARTSKPTHPTIQLHPEQGWGTGQSQGQLSSHLTPSLPELKGEGGGVTTSPSSDGPSLSHYPVL